MEFADKWHCLVVLLSDQLEISWWQYHASTQENTAVLQDVGIMIYQSRDLPSNIVIWSLFSGRCYIHTPLEFARLLFLSICVFIVYDRDIIQVHGASLKVYVQVTINQSIYLSIYLSIYPFIHLYYIIYIYIYNIYI